MLRRIIEKTRTEAHFIIITLKNVKIATSAAALPKLFIIGELGKGYRMKPQVVIDLHYCKTGGDAEYLRIGIKSS